MNTEKENWINEVMGSLDGMKASTPPVDLLDKIQNELDRPKNILVSMVHKRIAIAAAVLLLLANVSVFYSFSQSPSVNSGLSVNQSESNSLISTFNIYD